jgi:hypothetical protein
MQIIALNWKLPVAFVAGALAVWLAGSKGAAGVSETVAGVAPASEPAAPDDGAAPNETGDFIQLG